MNKVGWHPEWYDEGIEGEITMKRDDPRWESTHCKCGRWIFKGDHFTLEGIKERVEWLEKELKDAKCFLKMMHEERAEVLLVEHPTIYRKGDEDGA
jgi:hypothetical protein